MIACGPLYGRPRKLEKSPSNLLEANSSSPERPPPKSLSYPRFLPPLAAPRLAAARPLEKFLSEKRTLPRSLPEKYLFDPCDLPLRAPCLAPFQEGVANRDPPFL